MQDWDVRGAGSCCRGLGDVEETFCGEMEGLSEMKWW